MVSFFVHSFGGRVETRRTRNLRPSNVTVFGVVLSFIVRKAQHPRERQTKSARTMKNESPYVPQYLVDLGLPANNSLGEITRFRKK